jgi:4-hydroxy-4-methyl-2-oxoglutarate aldolase
VSCGDEIVRPGDVIVADDDGVVVVPRLSASAVVYASQARIENEERSRARYQAGELGLDVNDMRGRLKERGLTYLSQSEWESGQ